MMRFVVLCALALAVAAAPYLNKETKKDEGGKVRGKRSQEVIMFGNRQNKPRNKKSDPSMPLGPVPKPEHPVQTMEEAVESELPRPVLPTVVAVPEHTGIQTDAETSTIPTVVNDDSANLQQLLMPHPKAPHPAIETPHANMADTDINSAVLRQIYGPGPYTVVPYNNQYYEDLRRAFRKKRQATLLKRAAKRRRSKRDLGYNGEIYPYEAYDEAEDADEVVSLLGPYIREALREKYADELEQPSYTDDGLYTGYDEEPELYREEPPVDSADGEDIRDLVDSYLGPQPDPQGEEWYEPPVDKRSGFLSMMPGQRKRFSYPYSVEPAGHWGAFVPGEKREAPSDTFSDETYDKLYKLASALARRNAYNSYLEALEAYRK